jgi:hypothetical protein
MSSTRRKWALVGTMVLLAMMLLACIKIGPREKVVTPVPPTATPIPPTATAVPPTPTPIPQAEPQVLAVMLCRGLTDDGRPFAETDTYSEIDPFAVSIQVANMKPRNVVSAHWYQGDAEIGLTEQDKVTGEAYVGMSLEPQGRWTPGDYLLEVSLDGEVAESREFSVIGAAKVTIPGGDDGGTTVTSGELTTYRNTDLGFSIDYPSNWTVEEADAAVQFSHPQDSALALVMIDPEPASTSEEEAEAVFAAISQNLPNAQKTSSEAQGDGWHGVFFTVSDNGTNVLAALLSNVVGTRGYNLLFMAVQSDWENMSSVFEQMWSSFQTTADGGPTTEGEVLMAGVVVDADTGRGIANAVVVILKEGVTIDQFTNSGNDKSLIYDAAQSGSDGSFQMNLPLARGSSYAAFAVAEGYTPVVDQLDISDSIPNPWQVRVSMQKE